MNSKQFTESTTSGAIASVSTPVGKTQTRGKGVYPNEKGGNLLTGKVVEVLNTKATGTWDISSPNWGMDNFMFTASNGVLYQLDFLDPYIGPDELGPESFDFATNLDDAVWDKLVNSAKFISFEQVNVNDKYEPGKQGIEGTGAAAEVFGSVVNAIFDYIKKKRPSMLYFQAVEPNRIRLYKSMINRLLKKLPGWNAEQAGSRGAHFAVYNEQLLKRLVSKKVKPMKEAQTMSQALANTLSKAEPGSKLDQKIKHHNSQVKQTGKGTLDKAPTGYHMDKKGYIRIGVSEAKLDEEDVIIVPGQGNRIKPGFIPKDKDRTDHEVEMAKSDLFQANKNAKKIYELIKDIPESVGIEGWVQEKIIKANDYLNTVREYLEHKQVDDMTGVVEQDVAEGSDNLTFQQQRGKWYCFQKTLNASPIGVGNTREEAEDNYRRKTDPDYGGPEERARILDILRNADRQGVAEGYRVLPSIDRERYGDRSYEGLEGPFRARNGKVYYYDPKAGMAYDPDTDIYIDYDELKMMDTEMSEDAIDTKKKISKYEELALAANRAGDDEKCKLYQRKIQALKQKMTQNVDEGIVGKVLGGAALLAALWGVGQNQAQQVYSNSPQLQTLIKYHQMATQQGDQAKIQELERRIENHKTRLSLGKGEVMGPDDKPIVPSFESSIMKGIQNEQSYDWGSMSKSEFKRREMQHELGDEDKQERQNWYIRINGKILKDKQKNPYTFRGRNAANKAALTMMSKPFNAGKKFTITTSWMDAPDTDITEVAKSSFRQSAEDQASRYVEQIKDSNMSDWEKEYLILVNDPKGKVFRAMYHSFPKGQEARKLVVDYIANKYGVSTDEIEKLDMNELARSFTESKCPECGGKLVAESELNEEGNKDACYHKVKSRYKVWPSAYASGALVKCRKVGASNWGNKSK